ncbi:SRPBCC domain-containing protein [Paenibacillus antri]|uniref:SRPBCC domain-containing protein n=1 Tax=Paenibacillus antri TaxID=2582848 RepID=A0A5R9GAX6_9BACL|nr:SRPBCC domain-containing protein [Paenibacillus antri]TLS52229.1 SRPBCC domain-containing protein [Paenibacillus antri]
MTIVEKGKTAGTGYQVGVRRTWPVSLERAWDWLMSPSGMSVWLEADVPERAAAGAAFATRDGVQCEVRVVNERENVRLRWRKPEWERASTVQVRTIAASPDKTTISFHQEQLADATTREAMKRHWESVSIRVGQALAMDDRTARP